MDVYRGLVDEPLDSDEHAEAVERLLDASFVVDTDDAGWIAEYTAGIHRVRVEEIPGGWLVSQVRVAGSVEWVKTAVTRDQLAEAADRAVKLVSALNERLRLVGSLTAPLLAEMRRTS